MSNTSIQELYQASAALHQHLCPRQVLGVRMGLFAGEKLELAVPQKDKRLLTIVETDGCFSDGVAVATNCWVGKRTMRVEDFGKIAATFVDTRTGVAIRVVPKVEARELSCEFAPEARSRWEEYLLGYQRMPVEELFASQRVQLVTPIEKIISQEGIRAICDVCGEEIFNQREIVHQGQVLCLACVGASYYTVYESLE